MLRLIIIIFSIILFYICVAPAIENCKLKEDLRIANTNNEILIGIYQPKTQYKLNIPVKYRRLDIKHK